MLITVPHCVFSYSDNGQFLTTLAPGVSIQSQDLYQLAQYLQVSLLFVGTANNAYEKCNNPRYIFIVASLLKHAANSQNEFKHSPSSS